MRIVKKIILLLLRSEHIWHDTHLIRKQIRLPHHVLRGTSILIIIDIVINVVADEKLLRWITRRDWRIDSELIILFLVLIYEIVIVLLLTILILLCHHGLHDRVSNIH